MIVQEAGSKDDKEQGGSHHSPFSGSGFTKTSAKSSALIGKFFVGRQTQKTGELSSRCKIKLRFKDIRKQYLRFFPNSVGPLKPFADSYVESISDSYSLSLTLISLGTADAREKL